ncbi:hypothetical protein [Taibaiella koreensis]|uniref:hypothetical protein n=1 Tax=Taibaiella koreensis TaxID=1268548 RepID=UPI000E5A0B9C|nr:hypothetical protein [Taibaiella koreensis]
MKNFFKFTISILTIVSAGHTYAQQLGGPDQLGNYYTDNGLITLKSWAARTAIGASWGGDNTLYGTGYIGFNIAHDGNLQKPWTYLGDGGESNGGQVIYGDIGGNLSFATRYKTGGTPGNLSNDDIRSLTRMRIGGDGKVTIGSSFITQNIPTPGDYKLYVESGILTERVRVAVMNTADWADYVFGKDYKMRTLPQLEQFIQQNKHLPDVPSAAEAVAQGIDLQKMDARLLQKVEELTLYILQQQKEIDALKVQAAQNR